MSELASEPDGTVTTPDLAPLRRHRRGRIGIQVACLAVTASMAVPLYLIALAALSTRASLNAFPLSLLPTNLSTAEIGDELFVSVHTVSTHVRHIYAKLGVHRRSHAVDRGRTLGLLTGPPQRR